jgi:hypothetical protein
MWKALAVCCAVSGQLMLVSSGAVADTRFQDVTASAGLSSGGVRASSAWRDYDRDGLPDVLIASHLFDRPALFRNQGGGKFKDVTIGVVDKPTNLAKCEVPGEPVGPWGDHHGWAWADFDNDGDRDIIALVGAMRGLGCGPNQLYVNNGNNGGHFTDRAVAYKIDYQYSRGRMPTWLDYNNDGILDLFHGSLKRPDGTSPPALFRGTKTSFVDVRLTTKFQPIDTFGAFLGDFVGGSRMELLMVGPLATALPRAPGAVSVPATSLRFVDTTAIPFKDVTPIRIDPTSKYDLGIADFDGDLRADIFVANSWTSTAARKGHQLYLNRNTGFVNATATSGVNTILRSSVGSTVAADFDNDGDVDIYINGGVAGTGEGGTEQTNLMLWNNGNGKFRADATAGAATGSATGGPDMVTVADYDVDGRVDILLTYFKSPVGTIQLYRNIGTSNHWLEIDLEGTLSNRDAIGAKVFVTAGGKTQVRAQNGGVHFLWGQNDQRLHFGLGANSRIDQIRVVWPKGSETILRDVVADRLIRIIQG